VFPNAEKASMVVRLTAAAGALGVGRVLVSTDTFGVSAAVLRESRRRAEAGDPRSKLRTSRHARATSSAVATAWWENWASRKQNCGLGRRAARRAHSGIGEAVGTATSRDAPVINERTEAEDAEGAADPGRGVPVSAIGS
jgi:hypothetical protein